MQQISQRLTVLAEKINKLAAGQGSEAVMSMQSAWVSENTAVFEKKANAQLGEVIEAAKELHTLSKEVEKKAQQIYQAEKWNMLTAKARRYR